MPLVSSNHKFSDVFRDVERDQSHEMGFFSKPLFTQKEKLNLKTYNSTLLDIYRISVGEKLKNIKRKYNNPKIYT